MGRRWRRRGQATRNLRSRRLDVSGLGRLAEIVVKHCWRDEGLFQTVRIALAASAPGDGLITASQPRSTPYAGIGGSKITERLVAAGRFDEALHWVEPPDVPALERENIARLKVDILDQHGRTEDAHAVRWPIFATSLSSDILAEYLGRLPQAATADARQRAIAAAHGSRDTGPPLLADLVPDIAAELVHHRLPEIRGAAYYVLRPVAERLAETDPLAAILLYRELAAAVLRRRHPLQYVCRSGSNHLTTAKRLVPNVQDCLGHLSQEAYRRRVATEHRQKRAFWQRMERAGLPWRG